MMMLAIICNFSLTLWRDVGLCHIASDEQPLMRW